jgi:hypothetical protein
VDVIGSTTPPTETPLGPMSLEEAQAFRPERVPFPHDLAMYEVLGWLWQPRVRARGWTFTRNITTRTYPANSKFVPVLGIEGVLDS